MPLVVIGLPVMLKNDGTDAETLVTVPTLIEPPRLVLVPLIVIAELASCAFVTVPDRSVVGIVLDAVNALVPLPLTYPVKVVAPVPPLATIRVPPKVIAPVVAVLGVKPVVPPLNDVTPPVEDAHVGTPPAKVKT